MRLTTGALIASVCVNVGLMTTMIVVIATKSKSVSDVVEGRTVSFFPSWSEIHWKGGTWIVDSGYPRSQICTDDASTSGLVGDRDAPICDSIRPLNVSGILGSSFLSETAMTIGRHRYAIDVHAPPANASCFAATPSNEQWSFEVTYGNVSATCFMDTGGGASLMSESLAQQLALTPTSTRVIQAENASGVYSNHVVGITSDFDFRVHIAGGALDVTPPRFIIVPDSFHVLFGFECSVGDQYLQNLQYLYLNLGQGEVCAAPFEPLEPGALTASHKSCPPCRPQQSGVCVCQIDKYLTLDASSNYW